MWAPGSILHRDPFRRHLARFKFYSGFVHDFLFGWVQNHAVIFLAVPYQTLQRWAASNGQVNITSTDLNLGGRLISAGRDRGTER
jgi:hypothetical protein